MKVLALLLFLMSSAMGLYTLYYFVIAVRSVHPLKKVPQSDPCHRFGIVVAARNEERVIGSLIQSLQELDYPADHYEIIVIPNNCTDQTAERAREAGATIFSLREKVGSKGEVLHHFFREMLKQKTFDAYCIFDADNLVEPDFLEVMNNHLAAGTAAAQGFRDSLNASATWVSACNALYYYCVNRLYNHPRSVLGMNSIINGTGFMVSHGLVERLQGWNTCTLTEDAETTVLCALAGERIDWAPEARFYDEQPEKFYQSWRQRLRWSTGSQQGFLHYARPLWQKLREGGGRDVLDSLLMLLVTYMQMVGLGIFFLTLFLLARKPPKLEIYISLGYWVSLFTMLFLPTIISAGTLWLENKPFRPMLKGVFTFWFFLLSWIPINIITSFKKTTDWKPIEHAHSMTVDEMMKKDR